jgi:signal transduction histidine kinase
MGLIESLLLVYAGLLLINVGLSALLWARQRNSLPRSLFFVWASQVAAFVAQGMAQHNSLAIVYGFSVTFLANLAVAFLLGRVVGLTVPWRGFLALYLSGCVTSAIAFMASQPFWVIALPVCIPVALPLLHTVTRTLRTKRSALTTTGWALAVTCLAFSAHNIDFAFLRDRPQFAVAGFTIAILLAFALGTTAPAVVLERVAQERARVEELDRFKSKFFASITHELKTPLTMILASLDLLIDGELGSVTALQRSTLQAMSRSGIKLLKLIGDLLDLSKLEESRLRLRIDEHDLVVYLRGLLQQTAPLAERKAVGVQFSADRDEILAWCDLDRMERVFINLLSNAFKFTPSGGVVSVHVTDEGPSVLVSVADTGPGFPVSLSARLFERFFQVEDDAPHAHGGAGIGLALARELVELHRGTISAESEPDKGATFSVRLLKGRDHFDPSVLDRRSRQTDKPKGQRASDVGLAGWDLGFEGRYRFIDIDQATEKRVVQRDVDEGQRAHTVLVVEDTPDVVRVVHLALRQHFRVFSAPDGAKGFAMAVEHRPTLIITDLTMPEVDGLELTRRLRADARTRHIPVVMLTARGDLDDRVLGLETGVNAYLTKPFAPKELLSTVRSLLNTQESTAELLLSQQAASLESIAGGLAHEIRNPLNYIKNAVLSIHRDVEELASKLNGGQPLSQAEKAQLEKGSVRMKRMFDTAESGVKRIGSTVDLMLRYSREGYTRALQPYDVYAAVRDVIEVVVPATGSDAKVETSFVGDGTIECVPEEINQLTTNLIQNGLEAVSPGKGLVEIAGRVEGGELVLTFRDNGAGIKPEDQSRIFTPFFTTKDVGLGLGMGLTITRRCVVALGGSISVRSTPNTGTEFTVRLPRDQKRGRSPVPPATRPRETSDGQHERLPTS